MTVRIFRCGTSNTTYQADKRPAARKDRIDRKDEPSVRLRTRLHVAAARPVAHPFRVVAQLLDGSTALVCLGATRQETCARARDQRRRLPPHVVAVVLEQWVGGFTGGWRRLPGRPGELPRIRRPRLCRDRHDLMA